MIWAPLARGRCAAYWRKEFGKLEAVLKDLGSTDLQKCYLMKAFSHHIGEILATVTDILQLKEFEQLKSYGFSDGPSGGRVGP